MQHFQKAPAYFVTAVSYVRLMFMKSTPGGSVGEGVEGAEGQADVPLAGGDGVANVDGADGLDLKDGHM